MSFFRRAAAPALALSVLLVLSACASSGVTVRNMGEGEQLNPVATGSVSTTALPPIGPNGEVQGPIDPNDAQLGDPLGTPAGDMQTANADGSFDVLEPVGALLEGEHRPGHFRGVATVCLKLFTIVRPDLAFFGQKDAQQVEVLRRMIADLHLELELVVVPTVRDADGLALSSRNVRLSRGERDRALALPRALATKDPATARAMLDAAGLVDPRLLAAQHVQVVGGVAQARVRLDDLVALPQPVQRGEDRRDHRCSMPINRWWAH